jgi:hypothetical protein
MDACGGNLRRLKGLETYTLRLKITEQLQATQRRIGT